MARLLFVFGTRPEAIKLCPLIEYLRHDQGPLTARVCVTAQHRSMLDQVLDAFAVRPDHDLDLMKPGQTLAQTTAAVVGRLEPVITAESPDFVVVQGDTSSTLGGALAAFYARVPVVHIEAGLRTGDPNVPFPEEMNRRLVTRLSTLHMAATESAARALRDEGVASSHIAVTGNTVIDAVAAVREKLLDKRIPRSEWPFLDPRKRLVLVTAHRRESFGDAFERICRAVKKLASRPDVQIVYPVHRNPNVVDPVERLLRDAPNVHLIDPLAYVPFVDLMMRSHFILTDSGGIQEEAPSLGKPVLVMRQTTERQEGIEAGVSLLVGTDLDAIVQESDRLLDNTAHYNSMARTQNPYGDGHACERITTALNDFVAQTDALRQTT
ncbi:MAG: UDP-N-acetylglucosamine 2-epimerase (non-hydrolyzing) [Acidobacteria bacterium]|nr:UDP-N-acetylglucosamine 2-epimerase (non-hydrolyzing) [Acidobacteriota bacterium]